MNIKVVTRSIDNAQKETAARWLSTLTQSEKDELARLDYDSPNNDDLAEITKDWIEEHGGERDFWGYLRTEQ